MPLATIMEVLKFNSIRQCSGLLFPVFRIKCDYILSGIQWIKFKLSKTDFIDFIYDFEIQSTSVSSGVNK
jgi:hypothetical protein